MFEGLRKSMAYDPLPLDRGNLLVVEDNPKDVRFIEEAFGAISEELVLHFVHTVSDALDYLRGRGEIVEAPDPDVILFDWHLAQETGDVVLEAAKALDSAHRVVVMTGSISHMEVVEESTTEAVLCIEKPTDPNEYVEIVRSLNPVNEAGSPSQRFSSSQI